MLIIPGFFTDGVGFLLLLPPVRSLLLDFVVVSIMTGFTSDFSTKFYSGVFSQNRGAQPAPANDDDVIDAQHIVIDKKDTES